MKKCFNISGRWTRCAGLALVAGLWCASAFGQGETPSINGAALVNWRTNSRTFAFESNYVSQITFSYLGAGAGIPSRSGPLDNSANNQGDVWSDDALRLDFSFPAPQDPDWAILIYTNNASHDASDPLNADSLRGGLVGGAGSGNPDDPSRASVLPLIWKFVSDTDLNNAALAKVNGSPPIPNSSAAYMPTEITNQTGGSCLAEGPYGASVRTNNGFCDYSTHYMLDLNNTDANNLFFTGYPSGSVGRAHFDYTALVNSNGVSSSEGGGAISTPPNPPVPSFTTPAFFLLGVNASQAVQTSYSATIVIEVRNY
jgi:hypothetical protein